MIFVCLMFCFCSVLFFGASAQKEEVEITLSFDDKQIAWSDEKCLNTQVVDYENLIQKRGLRQSHKDRVNLIEKIVSMGFSYEEACGYVFPKLNQMVDDFAGTINKNAVDATAKFTPNKTNKFEYTKEEFGRYVDKEELYQKICQNLHKTNKVALDITPKIITPKVTKKDLVARTQLVSCFETDYNKSGENRKHNIETALKAFNGLVLEPNKEYSFNQTTGRRTEEKGYREANIIVNNEYVEGFGGGVCQVSTTLYNALLLADVNVLESHPHSLESSYVQAGFDAMVNYGSSDLKFVNNKNYPLYIRTYHKNGKIGVEVYGKPVFKIQRKSKIMEETKLDDVVLEDGTLLIGEKRYKTQPKTGKKVLSYLEYTKGGKVIKTKKLRISTYKPVQGVLLVGTKKDEKAQENQTFSQFQTL